MQAVLRAANHSVACEAGIQLPANHPRPLGASCSSRHGQGQQQPGRRGTQLGPVQPVLGAGFEQDGGGHVQEIAGHQPQQRRVEAAAQQLGQHHVVAEHDARWRVQPENQYPTSTPGSGL